MKPLIVIPARAGSKGVPGKNIKKLNGKPLIHYTIEAAQAVFDNAQIYVSTDSEAIKSTSEELGLKVPFLRPSKLATDTASSRDVILHAIDQYDTIHAYIPDIVILLQPTSPFRNGDHIKEALALYNNTLDMVVSVKETDANPYYVLFEEDEQQFLRKSKSSSATRRQDVPKVWELNGAIYIINSHSIKTNEIGDFKKIVKYEMNSHASIDIDSPLDWQLAELIAKEGHSL